MNSIGDENFIYRNNIAISTTMAADFIDAQMLFEQNVKDFPLYLTYHNLGVFYASIGIFDKNGCRKDGRWKGIRYVCKAIRLHPTYQSWCALGESYYSLKKYRKAAFSFIAAANMKNTPIVTFNCALANMLQKKYLTAYKLLSELEKINDSNIEKQEVLILESFCSIKLRKKKVAEKHIDMLFNMGVDGNEMDAFAIAFLCGKEEYCASVWKKMLRDWSVDIPILAMLLQCNYLKGYKQIEEYIKEQIANCTTWKERFPYLLLRYKWYRHVLISKYMVIGALIDSDLFIKEMP